MALFDICHAASAASTVTSAISTGVTHAPATAGGFNVPCILGGQQPRRAARGSHSCHVNGDLPAGHTLPLQRAVHADVLQNHTRAEVVKNVLMVRPALTITFWFFARTRRACRGYLHAPRGVGAPGVRVQGD
jgi:hypothetical protein